MVIFDAPSRHGSTGPMKTAQASKELSKELSKDLEDSFSKELSKDSIGEEVGELSIRASGDHGLSRTGFFPVRAMPVPVYRFTVTV